MNINGNLNETELIKYISLNIKLETIKSIVNSEDTAERKVSFLQMFLKEDK